MNVARDTEDVRIRRISTGPGPSEASGSSSKGTTTINGNRKSSTTSRRGGTPPSIIPSKRKQPTADTPSDPPDPESIRCICGFTSDDGWSIGCDGCGRWVHGVCFGIEAKDKENLPERWWCWECDDANTRVEGDERERIRESREKLREKARAIQRGRMGKMSMVDSHKRRRASSPADDAHHLHIDIPDHDIIPHNDIRERLRRQAAEWRGISAISPGVGWPYFDTTPVIFPSYPKEGTGVALHTSINPSTVLPPTYALHTTAPIPSQTFLAPFPSLVTSSATYLRDPLNAYARLGMPKPRVHLMGPPLDLALDARGVGGPMLEDEESEESEGKMGSGMGTFVRSGCRPNAVLRPVICDNKQSEPDSDSSLSFALFALRDLKANEEVVLGWEWDDANVVHLLPALLRDESVFPPAQISAYKLQMANILRALGATFTTCACGESAQGCVLKRMREFVEGEEPKEEWNRQFLKSGFGFGFTTGHSGFEQSNERGRRPDISGEMSPLPSPIPILNDSASLPIPTGPDPSLPSLNEPDPDTIRPPAPAPETQLETDLDLGPLIGVPRGFRTRERIPGSGGLGGVEMDLGYTKEKPGLGPKEEGFPSLDGTPKGREQREREREKADVGVDTVGHGPPAPIPLPAPVATRPERQKQPQQNPYPPHPQYSFQSHHSNHIPNPNRYPAPRFISPYDALPYSYAGYGQPPSPYAPSPYAPLHAPSPSLYPHYPHPHAPSPYSYGQSYPFPHDSTSRVRTSSTGIGIGMSIGKTSTGKKELFWGEPPLPPDGKGKGKARAVDHDEEGGESVEEWEPREGVEESFDEDHGLTLGIHSRYTHSQPQLQRHRRKPTWSRATVTVNPQHHAEAETEESEIIPPKMKRRWRKEPEVELMESRSLIPGERAEPIPMDVDLMPASKRKPSISMSTKSTSPAPVPTRNDMTPALVLAPAPAPAPAPVPVPARTRTPASASTLNDTQTKTMHPPPQISISTQMTPEQMQMSMSMSMVADSPLLSLANLSLMSPAITIPPTGRSVSRGSGDRDMARSPSGLSLSLRDSRSQSPYMSRTIPTLTTETKPSSRSKTSKSRNANNVPTAPPLQTSASTASTSRTTLASRARAVTLDPLAALAAAAAAARPISPLPPLPGSLHGKDGSLLMSRRDDGRSISPRYGPSGYGYDPTTTNSHRDRHVSQPLPLPLPPYLAQPSSDGSDEIKISLPYDASLPHHISLAHDASPPHDTSSTHDAVLGPGGIRVLSSPEHNWVPLRRPAATREERGSISSASPSLPLYANGDAGNGNGNGEEEAEVEVDELDDEDHDNGYRGYPSMGRTPLQKSTPKQSRQRSLDGGKKRVTKRVTKSLRVKQEMMDEVDGSRIDDDAMQIDDGMVVGMQVEEKEGARGERGAETTTPHPECIAPVSLSPSTPPTRAQPQNLDDNGIPPWVASPKSTQQSSNPEYRSGYALSSPRVVPSVTASESSQAAPSTTPSFSMTATLTRHESLTVSSMAARARKEYSNSTSSSSPLSSPLSSPVEGLISLPAHSAPPDHEHRSSCDSTGDSKRDEDVGMMNADPDEIIAHPYPHPQPDSISSTPVSSSTSLTPTLTSKHVPYPHPTLGVIRPTRTPTPTRDIPDLEHSTSMSPQSPATALGNISPATPREDVEDERGREKEHKERDREPVVLENGDANPNADVPPPSDRVYGEDDGSAPTEIPSLLESLTPQTPTISLAPNLTPSTPTPAPSKVKMSLKDFAMRKRRQKEEEQREKEEREKEERGKVGDNVVENVGDKKLEKDVGEEQEKEHVIVPIPIAVPSVENGEDAHSAEDVTMAMESSKTIDDDPPHSIWPTVSPQVPFFPNAGPTEWKVEGQERERKPSQSDVDVIMKASETLNKLMTQRLAMVNGNGNELSAATAVLATDNGGFATLVNGFVSKPVPAVLTASPNIPNFNLNPASSFATSNSASSQTFPQYPLDFSGSAGSPPNGLSSDLYKYSRRPTQEDGEIEDNNNAHQYVGLTSNTKLATSSATSPSPSFPPRPFKFLDPTLPNESRSRTPPTQPRSFAARSPSVTTSHGSPPMRNLSLSGGVSTSPPSAIPPQPPTTASASSIPTLTPTPANPALGRTPPSGPRALRQLQQQQAQQQHQHQHHQNPHQQHHTTGGSGGSGGGGGYQVGLSRTGTGYIPRSTPYDARDRDRFRDRGGHDFVKDRDRDREQHWNSGQRIRARDGGGGGWGR